MYSKPKRNIILNEKKYPKSYPLIIAMCILHVCAWRDVCTEDVRMLWHMCGAHFLVSWSLHY